LILPIHEHGMQSFLKLLRQIWAEVLAEMIAVILFLSEAHN
jgi:hypothetical protein